jgi:DNA-binding GntR family transcriptional regulator
MYQQVVRLMRARIESSEWPPGYRLPSEPTLAQFYQVNRDTLRKAVGVLADEGRLVVVRGKGTYVT